MRRHRFTGVQARPPNTTYPARDSRRVTRIGTVTLVLSETRKVRICAFLAPTYWPPSERFIASDQLNSGPRRYELTIPEKIAFTSPECEIRKV
jgi:hypothetical protein